MILIAVTGVIGSGKSSVARLLARATGLPLIDADQECALLLRSGEPGWLALRTQLDPVLFLPDGNLDRPGLRRAIFADSRLREDVNRLIHPLARIAVQARAAASRASAALVEVPLLFEAGWNGDFTRVVVVYAPATTCMRRLRTRDQIDLDEAGRALAAQLPIALKALQADHVIDNSGARFATELQVLSLASVLRRDL